MVAIPPAIAEILALSIVSRSLVGFKGFFKSYKNLYMKFLTVRCKTLELK